MIAGLRQHHKLADLLQVAGLARSTYYYQCLPNVRAEQQSDMQCRIRAVYDKHKGRYGYRRITATLSKSMAEPVNHKCVQRLMQQMGLRALIRAKKRARAVPGVSDMHVPNVLRRDFCATAPNQKWVTDITEFNVNGNKLYLSACMDLYNSQIIAHRMARRPRVRLGLWHARRGAFAIRAYPRADRAFGSGLTLQNATLQDDACA